MAVYTDRKDYNEPLPEMRHSLLRARKLGKTIIVPGINNCLKAKTSVKHLIPIMAIGFLFCIQTCADEEIRCSDLIENKWICWHKWLGNMQLETLKHVISSCQGLENLHGVAMRHNYISQNVQMGEAPTAAVSSLNKEADSDGSGSL